MFKDLLSFWKGKDFLTQVLGEFENMLKDAEGMYRVVMDKLLMGKDEPGLKDKIYRVDKEINALERDIRKRIVEHLSIQPKVDVNVCLVLMSVVKDAERLGDYAKNLHEVTELLNKPLAKELIEKYLKDVDRNINDEFVCARQAFLNSDEAKAREILGLERSLVKRCDAAVKELAKSQLSTNEAVALTLMARYLKRIAAHLANIATSVILPISDLDFFDEKMRHE